jgi:curved DNA-binding protein CbpA
VTDYFAVLGLRRTASDREIKEAYRRLAKMYHPDPNPGDPEAARKMQSINEAKMVLFDSVKREEHRVVLGLREKLTSERIGEIRRDARFAQTSVYSPLAAASSGMPQSKWDRTWSRYFAGIVGVILLGAITVIAREFLKQEPDTSNPINTIIARYHQMDRLPFGGGMRDARPTQAELDTMKVAEDSPERLKRHGNILFSLAEYRSAAKYYELYLRKQPDDDTVIRNLSFAYFKRGRYAESLEVLSKQLRGDSNLVVAYYNIGQSFLHEEKPFDARDAFAAAVKIADTMRREGKRPPEDALRARNALAKLE